MGSVKGTSETVPGTISTSLFYFLIFYDENQFEPQNINNASPRTFFYHPS